MTTLNKEPKSQLGKRLQFYRTDRPDEFTMDEFTRMAEELNDQLTDAQREIESLKGADNE